MAKLSEMSDQQIGAMVRKRAADHEQLFRDGHIESRPHEVLNGWRADVADARRERDSATGELERNDQPAEDNPPPTPGTPRPPVAELDKPAQDSRPAWSLTADELVQSDHLQRSNPRTVTAMTRGIPGYGRLK
jgi:hypothetical protein